MIAADLFDWPESLAAFAGFFPLGAAPWSWLPQIAKALAAVDFETGALRSGSGVEWSSGEGPWGGASRPMPPGLHVEGAVYLHPTVKLPPFGAIYGPCWIGPGCELRPGVYLRGNVIAGANCVLGNSSEFKNCLLLDGVQAPHFNYVGDSILGNFAHLGAGVILANLRLDQKTVPASTAEGRVDSGLRKLGGILGDHAEAGCNAVINPGSILERRAVVMPGTPFSGHLVPNTLAYCNQPVKRVARRD